MLAVFFSFYSFFTKTMETETMRTVIPEKLIHLGFLGFFVLLFFSNLVAALGYFYSGRDLPFLLSLPISPHALYFSKLLQMILTSSWMFFLFAVPIVFAYVIALAFPISFVLLCVCVTIPFLIIPATLSSIVVTLFVNIVPAAKARELLGFLVLLLMFATLTFFSVETSHIKQEPLEGIESVLLRIENPTPAWLPPAWAAGALGVFFGKPWQDSLISLCILVFASSLFLLAGLFTFKKLFMRAWTLSYQESAGSKTTPSPLLSTLGRILIPWNPQLRAIVYKDARMFLRDPTQCIQLLLLLLLAFVYLYNFRTLQTGAAVQEEIFSWWKAVLALANISLGGCVISAIATRFVFPCMSLEGKAYWLVRAAPLTIQQLLQKKFLTWIGPISIVSLTLFLSGAWATELPEDAIWASAAISLSLSIGIVGLGIGIGSVYACFDWENPVQVTANFGSLIYMLLTLGLVMVTSIPSALLIVITIVPYFATTLSPNHYLLARGTLIAFIFLINCISAKWGLKAGELALKQREC